MLIPIFSSYISLNQETGKEYLAIHKENTNENICKYRSELNKQAKLEGYNRK